ncbi:MAG: histone, partial [Proteobacteria bacterium]|nr:histone [Pseudomonadota bacterium]
TAASKKKKATARKKPTAASKKKKTTARKKSTGSLKKKTVTKKTGAKKKLEPIVPAAPKPLATPAAWPFPVIGNRPN